MSPIQRVRLCFLLLGSNTNFISQLVLLKTLVIWCLNTSEVVGGIIRESYKQARREDDVNQPLSVQPWGSDGRKRRYWLIEGQNDTPFRVYIENQPKLVKRTWWTVAGTLDELKAVSEDLMRDGGQADRRLAERFMASVPRLEQSEEVYIILVPTITDHTEH